MPNSAAIAELGRDLDRTVVVIAHRPAADHVVALAGGRVAEQGDPQDLLAVDGPCARLHRQYEHARSRHIAAT
ncbi:hypothetical protein ABZ816_17630 [Actinosynnema sp. NPDC047251]|uniref:hypothetical protein n=1 Tax=Saccharothrix espanaensis TaxID=103731 RepID=UPI0002F3ED16|nr:hypothetical protein [Saccharothrix espanaensis]